MLTLPIKVACDDCHIVAEGIIGITETTQKFGVSPKLEFDNEVQLPDGWERWRDPYDYGLLRDNHLCGACYKIREERKW